MSSLHSDTCTPTDPASGSFFRVGGSLPSDAPCYVEREADQKLYEHLKSRECCYVFNSRQMGKSSLRVRVIEKLTQDGIKCATLDPQTIGTQVQSDVWYASVVDSLVESFGLEDCFDFGAWWKERTSLSPVQCLNQFLTRVLLKEISNPIVIFIEEIDRLRSLPFPADDFFLLIRSLYEQRANDPNLGRLTFALVGVTTPRDLIQGTNFSPFNIGTAIEMEGFRFEHSQRLADGLLGYVDDPLAVLKEVLHWSDGQPFLTQKLLSLVIQERLIDVNSEDPSTEQANLQQWFADLVRQRVIENWEAQDQPEHLKTLQDRIVRSPEDIRGGLLGLYQKILINKFVPADDNSYEQIQLRLTGLVVKRDTHLVVYNPIYAEVFNHSWVQQQLEVLRPALYGEALRSWREASSEQRFSYLLRGSALEAAVTWAKDKSLADDDKEFIHSCQEAEKESQNRRLEEEERSKRVLLHYLVIAVAAFGVAFSSAYFLYGRNIENLRELRATSAKALLESDPLMATIESLVAFSDSDPPREGESDSSGDPGDPIKRMMILKTFLQAFQSQLQINAKQTCQGMVYSLIQPSENTLFSGGRDGGVMIWKIEAEGIVPGGINEPGDTTKCSNINDNKVPISSLIKLRHSNKLISGDLRGDLQLWSIGEDNKISPKLQPEPSGQGSVKSLKQLNENTLVSGGIDGTLQLWSLSTGKVTSQGDKVRAHKSPVLFLEVLPTGELVSVGADGGLQWWFMASDKLQRKVNIIYKRQSSITSLIQLNNGDLISGGSDGFLRRWRNGSDSIMKQIDTGHGIVRQLAQLKDGYVISVGSDNNFRIWKPLPNGSIQAIQNSRRIPTGQHSVTSLVGLDNGGVVSTGSDGILWLYRKILPKEAQPVKTNQGQVTTLVELRYQKSSKPSYTNGDFVSGGTDGSLKFWKMGEEGLVTTISSSKATNQTPILSLIELSKTGDLVSGAADGTLTLWRNGKKISSIYSHQGAVFSLVESEQNELISAGEHSGVGSLQRWHVTYDGKITPVPSNGNQTIPTHQKGPVLSLLRMDKKLISGGADGSLQFFQIEPNGTLKRVVYGNYSTTKQSNQRTVISLAKVDRNIFISGGGNGTLQVWHIKAGRLEPTGKMEETYQGWIRALVVTNGSVISGGYDGSLRLWRLNHHKLMPYGEQIIQTRQGEVMSLLALEQNHRLSLISGGEDGTLWSISDTPLPRKYCQRLEEHTNMITAKRHSKTETVLSFLRKNCKANSFPRK